MQQEMRSQVIDLELKARYWKAQYELRYYTLKSNEVEPEYSAYIKKQAEENARLQEEYIKQMEANKEAGIDEITQILSQEPEEANI
jgi:hypothetical protein